MYILSLARALTAAAFVSIAMADDSAAQQCNKPQGSHSTNPTSALFPANFADPSIIEVDGRYYAFATNHKPAHAGGPFVNVPLATSTDFTTGWNFLDDNNGHQVLPHPGAWTIKNEDGNAQVGAPDVNRIVRLSPPCSSKPTKLIQCASQAENHFVMYYSAKAPSVPGNKDRKCVGAATSPNVTGPYTAMPHALACPSEGVIGASGFQHGGHNYLLYKIGGHFDKTHTAHIHIRRLDESGTAWAAGSHSISLLNNTAAEYDVEGPNLTVAPDGGTFFLWFVTGFFRDADYAIRYLTADSLEGPFHNKGNEPPYLLRTGELTNGVFTLAPGGPDFVNATHMTFMATRPNATCGTGGKMEPETRHIHAAVLRDDGDTVKVEPA